MPPELWMPAAVVLTALLTSVPTALVTLNVSRRKTAAEAALAEAETQQTIVETFVIQDKWARAKLQAQQEQLTEMDTRLASMASAHETEKHAWREERRIYLEHFAVLEKWITDGTPPPPPARPVFGH